MVLFHKKRPLAHYRQIRSKSGSLSSGAGGSLSPASYAHFGPAKVVYYVRRFHENNKQNKKDYVVYEGTILNGFYHFELVDGVDDLNDTYIYVFEGNMQY